jgi:hypothetical protein
VEKIYSRFGGCSSRSNRIILPVKITSHIRRWCNRWYLTIAQQVREESLTISTSQSSTVDAKHTTELFGNVSGCAFFSLSAQDPVEGASLHNIIA